MTGVKRGTLERGDETPECHTFPTHPYFRVVNGLIIATPWAFDTVMLGEMG